MRKLKARIRFETGLDISIATLKNKRSKAVEFKKRLVIYMEDSVLTGFTANYIIGECEQRDKLIGYKAESYLKKVLKRNEETITNYLVQKHKFQPFKYQLSNTLQQKYKTYLSDKDARQYILDKYAEKLTIVDLLCFRLIDLESKECVKLFEDFEKDQDVIRLVDKIVSDYKNELKILL